jgi:hypothetical protein
VGFGEVGGLPAADQAVDDGVRNRGGSRAVALPEYGRGRLKGDQFDAATVVGDQPDALLAELRSSQRCGDGKIHDEHLHARLNPSQP